MAVPDTGITPLAIVYLAGAAVAAMGLVKRLIYKLIPPKKI